MKIRLLIACCLLAATASTTLAQDTVKIGFNYPQTGRYQQEGLQQRMAAFMAVDEINKAGGILNRQIELVIRDTGSIPSRGAANTAEMIDRHNAMMVFGGSSSAVAISSGRVAKERDRLYFGTLTYANDTTGSAGHTHMFREPYNAWMTAKALSQHLKAEYSGKRFFYITADYSWGWSTEDSVRHFTNTTNEAKHQSVLTPFPKAYIKDFSAALKAAEASEADVLIMALFGDDMVRALILAHEMGLSAKMQVVVPNLTLSMAHQVGPSIMEGIIGASPWTWQVPYQFGYSRGQKFVEDFSKLYQMRPSTSAASAYSILYQYKDAVERARTFDTQAVIEALEGHRYSLLKDEQEWREFDHQNVQTVYVVKSKPRSEVTADPLGADYFEIVSSMDGETAAQTLTEWQAERTAAGQPKTLR